MIDALAIAGLNERELDVFEKLLRKKEAVYKLRNPIAHWVLGHSDSYPELLIATDAKEYIRFDAKWRSVTNKMSAGEGTPSDLDEALLRLLNSSQAYDLEELNRISGQIADTAKLFVEFNFLLGVRIRDNDRKWHAEKFARLSQMLG
ncbi:hypothetical protein DEM25_000095 [Oceaniradius stylonematis]|uniref:Uncharacterized protein n=2 Tax=Oceaniradius stylonematis TaxID=2184161 RepID=A0A3A8AGG2_9HYPH|nr:hypothetical protein DEM25_000095 [Oceaniradius stylonematis]